MRGRVLFLFLLFVLLPAVILAVFFARSITEEPETINQKITGQLERTEMVFRRLLANMILETEIEIARWLEEISPGQDVAEVVEAACGASPLFDYFSIFDGHLGRRFPFTPPGGEIFDVRAWALREGVDDGCGRHLLAGSRSEFIEKDPEGAVKSYLQALEVAGDDLSRAVSLHALARVSFREKNFPEARGYYRRLYEEGSGALSLGGLSLDLIALLQLARIESARGEGDQALVYYLDIMEQLSRGRLAHSIEEASFFASRVREAILDLKEQGIVTGEFQDEYDRVTECWRCREETVRLMEGAREAARTELRGMFRPEGERKDGVKIITKSVDGREVVMLLRRLDDKEEEAGRILVVTLNPEGLRAKIQKVVDETREVEGDTNLVIYDGRGEELARGGDPASDSQYRRTDSLAPLFPSWEVWLTYRRRGFLLEIARGERRTRIGYISSLLIIIFLGLYVIYRLTRKDTELARLKSDFVSRVSHELRTPLATIRAVGEMLEMGAVSSREKEKEYFSFITSESERLSRLIDNVLDFSRIGVDKKKYSFRTVDIREAVSSMVRTFREYSRTEGFDIIFRADESLSPVSIDRDAIEQALINLMHNAVKFSREEKTIRVDLRQRGGEVRLSVADRGVGIAREDLGRIFEQFYQPRRDRNLARKGAGLGLAIVKHIMEAHGGRVEVESRPGEGSTFTLIFSAKK